MKRCLSSTTVACRTTSSTSFLKTNTPLSSDSAGWPCCGALTVGEVEPGLFAEGEVELAGGSCAGAVCGAGTLCAQIVIASRRKVDRGTRTRLFRRRIVTRLGINPQRRQTFRWNELHPYLTPFAVVRWVLWTVSEHILVA